VPPPGHPLRFTTIAHGGRTILGPLEPAELEAILDVVPLRAGGSAWDIGCGKGDLLVRLARRGMSGTGVDLNPWFLADARRLADGAGVGERVGLATAEAGAATLPGGADLVACIGATGALGGPAAAPVAMAAAVRRGGLVIIGEGCWNVAPEPGWLAEFGIEHGEMLDRDGTLGRMTAPGFEVLAVHAATEGAWDGYEDAYAGAVEIWAGANPEDPECDAFLARAAFMRATYAAWRRRAMGLLLVVLRRP
jgi:SAM-dependent methyltransferase